MKNYVQKGDVVDVTVGADIASGVALKVGSLFGVTQKAAKSGETVGLVREGVFDLPYGVAATAAVGDLIYWDDTGKTVTKTSSGNTKVGICMKAAASADATMRVLLVPTI